MPGAVSATAAAAVAPEAEPAVVEEAEVAEPIEMPRIKFDPGLAMGKAVTKPAVTPAAAVPAPVARPVTPKPAVTKLQEVKDDNYLTVPLAEVTEGWPDTVLEEIQQLDLSGAQFALPAGEIDLAMRKGRIVFKWQTLLSWVESGGRVGADTVHGDQDLTLPLKVVAPKFLALRQPKGRQKKAHVEESIPDLFMGGPTPGPVSAPAPAHAVAANVEPETAIETVLAPAPVPTPVKAAPPAKAAPKISAANPNDLVAKTAQLPGVSGSLLAMNDGLVVASQLPKPLQGETVSAFLPQIFGRLNQFSAELKLGELSSVMLVMDNSPWIIFRTGKVYFAVVGKPGEPLPLPQLTAIVADIKRQNL
jgi:predicted regulator of Ras-like GTPase activity (Roadblock/LC7/MglB family)